MTSPQLKPTSASDDMDVFRAIADPTRRGILDLLTTGPKTVNALADNFSQSRPGISKHLRVLRECGVVEETKSGRERYYRLKPSSLQPVDQWIFRYRQFWQNHLTALKSYIETNHDS